MSAVHSQAEDPALARPKQRKKGKSNKRNDQSAPEIEIKESKRPRKDSPLVMSQAAVNTMPRKERPGPAPLHIMEFLGVFYSLGLLKDQDQDQDLDHLPFDIDPSTTEDITRLADIFAAWTSDPDVLEDHHGAAAAGSGTSKYRSAVVVDRALRSFGTDLGYHLFACALNLGVTPDSLAELLEDVVGFWVALVGDLKGEMIKREREERKREKKWGGEEEDEVVVVFWQDGQGWVEESEATRMGEGEGELEGEGVDMGMMGETLKGVMELGPFENETTIQRALGFSERVVAVMGAAAGEVRRTISIRQSIEVKAK
ncbi:uncharacterized protein L3040_007360 [Drepanopeziza brunnea f. sp. 'multigermtubi']|uniref:Uncharacterized protein n=1 Tax=Marssonina brunnea f. sp. multigermtubi (strain MB_m1) TaxID=1072389 RepID=K1XAT4_MARBU|nr:uncharacterized protein MBM_03610 [Drepanopeziza brunnea f. sp. 'multigermtubi' MB_m1]EKD17838.1 hypothetical protein MBM_03610 [Drepanopeziza brunnea f. sp. 'multigermtubi' MB_m1]KAJ5037180.1 hypothetical protein L3040_007360 [Drepanopeziza brunnea f. sp. 'multigermtubi']